MSPGSVPAADPRDRIVGLAAAVRAEGVAVGVGAEVDLARAFERISLLDRAAVRTATTIVLARSPEEAASVAAVFDAFWSGEPRRMERPGTGAGTTVPRGRMGRSGRRSAPTAADPADASVPVTLPLGTWSRTAPGAGHPIPRLSERELRALRRGARRLRRWSATLPGRRRGRSRHGAVDVRDTVREGLRSAGELARLRHRAPIARRMRLAIAWDVSGSMQEHEGRLFGLVHALESVARETRVFAFSTGVIDVSQEVSRDGYRRAAQQVGRRIERSDGGTQIAASLAELDDRFGRALTDRTTLVILSDGWDLGDPERIGPSLQRIRRRVHAIVWVNPYARIPGFEPRVAALGAARPYVDRWMSPEEFLAPREPRPVPVARG